MPLDIGWVRSGMFQISRYTLLEAERGQCFSLRKC